jgi:hypothetical protein
MWGLSIADVTHRQALIPDACVRAIFPSVVATAGFLANYFCEENLLTTMRDRRASIVAVLAGPWRVGGGGEDNGAV